MAEDPVAGGLTMEESDSGVSPGSEPLSETVNPSAGGLASHLRNIWSINHRHKIQSGVQGQILANLRARDNTYEADKLAALVADGQPPIYMGLTGVKCSHAEAWMGDIFSSTDKTWGLKPTPKPELSEAAKKKVMDLTNKAVQASIDPQNPPTADELVQRVQDFKPEAEKILMQVVEDAAKKMETKIEDQLVQGGWQEAFDAFLSDVATCKLGILKGPIVRKIPDIEYVDLEDGSPVKMRETTRTKLVFTSVAPLDFFPAPSCSDPQKGNIAEKGKISRAELHSLMDEPGYDREVITEILTNVASAARVEDPDTDQDRAVLENKKDPREADSELQDDLDTIEFWVSSPGKLLMERGMETDLNGEKIEPLAEYDINAIMCADKLIFVSLNDNVLRERPYSVCGWKPVPGSIWFKGVPETMESIQSICNAAVRSLVYNMAIASGPQMEVDISRLAAGEDVETGKTGRVWQTVSKVGGANVPAIRYFQPGSNAQELLAVYDRFAQMADDYTGIPAYAFGNDKVAGAGRTSSGLSMLMGASAKGIKKVILNIDRMVFKTMIKRIFRWNMKHDPDPEIRGDLDVVSTGAVGIMVREQLSEKRTNFLNSTNNPVDLKLTGLEGRAAVLRETVTSIEMAPSKVVKSDKELKELAKKEEEMQAQQSQLAGQAQQVELEKVKAETEQSLAKAKALLSELEIKQQQLQLQSQSMANDNQHKTVAGQAKLIASQIQAAQAGMTALEKASQLEQGGMNETGPSASTGVFESAGRSKVQGGKKMAGRQSAGREGPE